MLTRKNNNINNKTKGRIISLIYNSFTEIVKVEKTLTIQQEINQEK